MNLAAKKPKQPVWLALMIALLLPLQPRAEGISTGVEQLLWPAIIVVAPFAIVHDVIFGSDERSQRTAERDARGIVDAYRTPAAVTGLYVGPVNLQWALFGMLIDRQLPFVEIDTAGSKWLLEQALNPQAMIDKALQHKHIRLELGDDTHPDCFRHKSSNADFTLAPPVRPGTCMLATFTNDLQSDLQLGVDASRVGRRELKWVLSDRASGRTLLTVPFWQPQTKGQPLYTPITYRQAHEDNGIIRLLKKLTPTRQPVTQNGRPYVMQHHRDSDSRTDTDLEWGGTVEGRFRAPQVDWAALGPPLKNRSWADAVSVAYSRGKPVVLNDRLLIDPAQDGVFPACANPSGRNCDFAHSSATEIGVVSVNTSSAYAHSNGDTAPLRVQVSARRFTGELIWYFGITRMLFPESAAGCANPVVRCDFSVDQVIVTHDELVLRGKFNFRAWQYGSQRPPGDYELVVSLDRIPPLRSLASGP